MLLISAVLVLFMQAGFAALESGMGPQNNTVNIMFKSFTDLCVGAFLFRLVGYSIMYGSDVSGGLGLIGWNGFGIESELSVESGPGVLHPQVDWLFQVAFAAMAATIVSGASIRIPIYTVEHGWKGYLEHRRPASNADPYRVTSRIMKTYAEAHEKAVS